MSTQLTTLDADAVPLRAGRPALPVAHRRRITVRSVLRYLPAIILAVLAVIGPWITPYDPERVVGPVSQAPSGKYLFGTDPSGLDVLSQTLAAARTDVLIATLAVVFASLIGVIIGLAAGMNESGRGPLSWLARFVTRTSDFVQAVPALLIGLVAVAFYGAKIATLIVALAIILAPLQARLVRTEVLKVRSDSYVDAARMSGLSELRLTVKHVLPNSCRPALENISVIFAVAIILTASLGFLGAGLPPPKPEWGSLMSRGASEAAVGRWWSGAFPALALVFAVAAVATAVNGLFRRRDA